MVLKNRFNLFILLFFSTKFLLGQSIQSPEERYFSFMDLNIKGESDSAFFELKKLNSDYPEYSKAYIKLIPFYMYHQKLAEGYSYFNNLIKADSTNGYAYYCLSRMVLRNIFLSESEAYHHNFIPAIPKDYQTAVAYLKKCISLNPDYANAYMTMAHIYKSTGKTEISLEYFEKASSKTFDHKIYLVMAYHKLFKIYKNEENFSKANKLKNLILQQTDSLLTDYPEIMSTHASVYLQMAEIYYDFGDTLQAQNTLLYSFELYTNYHKDKPNKLTTAYNLIYNYYHFYKFFLLLDNYDYAEKARNKIVNLKGDFWNNYPNYWLGQIKKIAQVYYELGAKWKAYNACHILAERAKQDNIYFYVYWSYATIGSILTDLGDYRQGLAYNLKALRIAEDYDIDVYNAYGYIGNIYTQLGNYDLGLEYINKALSELRIQNQRYLEAFHLSNVGFNLVQQEQYSKGLNYFKQAEKAHKANTDINQSLTSFRTGSAILHGIGDCYFGLKEYKNAEKYYKIALQSAADERIYYTQADILLSLGKLNLELNDIENAIDNFADAKEILSKTYFNQLSWRAELGLGESYYKAGHNDKAIAHLTNVIFFSDSLRKNLNSENMNQRILNDKYKAFHLLSGLYLKENDFERAYAIIEKYKSTVLLNVLSQDHSILNKLLSDSTALKVTDINRIVEGLHNKLSKLSDQQGSSEALLFKLKQQITELEIQKAAIKDSIEQNYPSAHQLISADPVSITKVQQDLLDEQTALLEYVVSDNNTIVFVITMDNIYYRELAVSREGLKTMLASLSALYRVKKSEDMQFNTNVVDAKMADFSITALAKAHDLLIKPLQSHLVATKQLIIVPDDLLYYLPFEALISDTSLVENEEDFKNARFLLQDYQISYVPSASVLNSQLNKEYVETAYDLLALGNPDYSGLDVSDTLSLSSPAYIRGLKNLQPLPHAQSEVIQISRILNTLKSKVFVNENASEENFKAFAKNTRILHLATHFMTNDHEPLYSKIALANSATSKEDGFLQPFEIFNMRLKADLVVLSACNTALGEISKGEGIMGVTRAFQYAGIPSLLVSQWNVDDRATSVIMTSFYSYLKMGFSKNSALQQAKLDYMKTATGKFNNPFYWAPFILIGNPGPIVFEKTSYMLYGLILLVVLLFSAWLWRRKLFHFSY